MDINHDVIQQKNNIVLYVSFFILLDLTNILASYCNYNNSGVKVL